MKLTVEERRQKIAVLLGDLEELAKDLYWIDDMVKATVGIAQQHYLCEKRKCENKIQKVKDALSALRASH
jgi:hypothetical protein